MTAITNFIQALQTYPFLQNALITAILIGIMSGLIGSFIILRGMSLMGDAISHSVLPGVALAYMLGLNVLLGASLFGFLAALLIGYISSKSPLKMDTTIGVVFSSLYALGFVLIHFTQSSTNLHHILFGNILAVSQLDLRITATIFVLVLTYIYLFYKELLITSLDEAFARSYGLPAQLIHYSLMLVLTLVTVSALQSVGIILVVAMLITPAATAYLWTDQLPKMMALSSFVAVLASIIGLYFSYTFNWASGPTIVLTAVLCFAFSFLFSKKGKRSVLKQIGLALVGMGLLLGAWTGSQERTTDRSQTQAISVVTTNSILEDMVQQVGQDRLQVYSLVPRGQDPHEYEPTTEDIAKVSDANLVFYNGLNLETGGNGWFSKMVRSSHKQFGKDVIAASQGVTPLYLSGHQEETDPHAWLDLANGIQYVQTITKALQEKDPKNASFYQKNADLYIVRLQALHQEAQSKFLDIPEEQRLLVTSEGAFKYFAKAYHVTPAYIWEINTEAQGTPQQLQTILDTIRQSKVQHLFLETSVAPKAMNQVAEQSQLKIYSTIFTDSLAKKGQDGDQYYTMMKWNLDKIYEGLK